MRAAGLVLVLLATLVLTGCSGSAPDPAPTPSPSPSPSSRPAATNYVALGDSYSSGAGTRGSPAVHCRRSPTDYGALAAIALGASYRDATCSGARTEHVTTAQPFPDGISAPPQLDAVTATTDVVSIGLGFNDHGFLRNLVKPGRDPARSEPAVPDIGRAVAQVVRLVAAKAPEARVLVVGYPQLAPARGTCATLPAETYAAVAALDAELEAVAGRTGATYVDVAAASVGHDVCAGDRAWVNGPRARPGEAAPYHPFVTEQRAVAELVVAALGP